MRLLFSWIRNNKIKFFLIDTILLAGNIVLSNFIQKHTLIDSDLILMFVAVNTFFAVVFVMSKIWLHIIQKLHITLPIHDLVEYAAYYIGLFLIILNIVMFVLIWIAREKLLIVYYAVPWLILISANTYNSIIGYKAQINTKMTEIHKGD